MAGLTTDSAFKKLTNDDKLWNKTGRSMGSRRIIRYRVKLGKGISIEKKEELLATAGFVIQQRMAWTHNDWGSRIWTTEQAFELLVNSDYLWLRTRKPGNKSILRHRINVSNETVSLAKKTELLRIVGFMVKQEVMWCPPTGSELSVATKTNKSIRSKR